MTEKPATDVLVDLYNSKDEKKKDVYEFYINKHNYDVYKLTEKEDE